MSDTNFVVVLSNGDRAEAEDPEAAVVAARTLISDLGGTQGVYSRTTASIYLNGKLVRGGIRYAELGATS